MWNKKLFLLSILAFILVTNGCAVIFQKGRVSDIEKIQYLESELEDLRYARNVLAKRLAGEIRDEQVSLKMEDKGLVITFVAEVLFASGKAKLKEESHPILNKVVKILDEEVPGNNIGIEGHTDNDPIKHSLWKSNWELSTQRALSVLYYLESAGINATRLSAIGYGEYRPVASNDSSEGRNLNRRVEVVILPKLIKTVDEEDLEEEWEYEDVNEQEEEELK